MGTRNLTIAYDSTGTLRIAQYGQWDGYPDGQGKIILEFLRNTPLDYKLRKCRFLTDREISKLGNNLQLHPHLSRNVGGNILSFVANGPDDGLALVNEIEFAKDSLFCEWAYVVDLQTRTFEVYRGFQQAPPTGRFAGPANSDGYYPVGLIKTYSLDALPTVEAFLEDLAE